MVRSVVVLGVPVFFIVMTAILEPGCLPDYCDFEKTFLKSLSSYGCRGYNGSEQTEGENTEGERELPREGEDDRSFEGEFPEGEVDGELPREGEEESPVEGEMLTETILLPGGVPLELVRIPAGSFWMGSSDVEQSRDSNEGPVHKVTINYDFYIGKYEVTQAQWRAVMGSLPEGYAWDYGRGRTYPAYYISWDDAQAFIKGLNAHLTETDHGLAPLRLPSEAEWEYACRAFTTTRFYFGDSLSVDDDCRDDDTRSKYMWYCGNNSHFGSKPVGEKLPNAFGLHDMSGNVYEWCEDDCHGDYTDAPNDGRAWIKESRSWVHVFRGGEWYGYAEYCRSAYRSFASSNHRCRYIGFRLAR